mmetsp:Transcript_3368/g.4740  ORF Transcript_3368/g.4740 Transcript_3368/m.4740 type:complete len:602 (-) Transcript_3368:273-2078(-)
MVVGTNLSFALNTALEKRDECDDYLFTFHTYNDLESSHLYKFEQLEPYDCGQCKEIAAQTDKKDDDTSRLYFQNGGCLKHKCKCNLLEESLPLFEVNFDGIVYRECLDLFGSLGEEESKLKWDISKVKAVWKNLHDAADMIFRKLILKFDSMRKDEEKRGDFDADYIQYNDYGAIDMFTAEADLDKFDTYEKLPDDGKITNEYKDFQESECKMQKNKLFLLYTLVYCTLNPGETEEKLLERLVDVEHFYDYLKDVNFQDFISVVPLITLFFKTHEKFHHFNSWDWSNIQNDLENLCDFFLKRSYLVQINDTGYNVYTAASVYHLAHRLVKFEEKAKSRAVHSTHGNNSPRAGVPEEFHVEDSSQMMHYFRSCSSYLRAIFLGYPRREVRAYQRQTEVQSSVERAILCLVLQSILYFGVLFISSDKVCYETTEIGSKRWRDFVSVTAIIFAFQYLVGISITEFYINTMAMFKDGRSLQRILIIFNVLVNSLCALTLIYSSALILKTSESFLDIVLNSVAVFFISELDDMMISDFDEETLNERTLQALVSLLRDLSIKKEQGRLSAYPKVEKYIVRTFAFVSLVFLLPLSLYQYFSGEEPDDC